MSLVQTWKLIKKIRINFCSTLKYYEILRYQNRSWHPQWQSLQTKFVNFLHLLSHQRRTVVRLVRHQNKAHGPEKLFWFHYEANFLRVIKFLGLGGDMNHEISLEIILGRKRDLNCVYLEEIIINHLSAIILMIITSGCDFKESETVRSTFPFCFTQPSNLNLRKEKAEGARINSVNNKRKACK